MSAEHIIGNILSSDDIPWFTESDFLARLSSCNDPPSLRNCYQKINVADTPKSDCYDIYSYYVRRRDIDKSLRDLMESRGHTLWELPNSNHVFWLRDRDALLGNIKHYDMLSGKSSIRHHYVSIYDKNGPTYIHYKHVGEWLALQ